MLPVDRQYSQATGGQNLGGSPLQLNAAPFLEPSRQRSERRAHDRERDAELVLDELSVEAENADAVRARELRVASRIGGPRGVARVRAAVDLDHEPMRGHEEVRDVRVKRVL